nr:MAG TPA: hypothetical protein [Bacteriophage sp.]
MFSLVFCIIKCSKKVVIIIPKVWKCYFILSFYSITTIAIKYCFIYNS